MKLSRTGWGETSLPVAFQTVEGRRAPWGCAAGAPYRGTASPPPPPPSRSVCVWMFVCLSPRVHVCKYVCVHARSTSWRKDMVRTADRCWCKKGEVWASKGEKRGRKVGETPE